MHSIGKSSFTLSKIHYVRHLGKPNSSAKGDESVWKFSGVYQSARHNDAGPHLFVRASVVNESQHLDLWPTAAATTLAVYFGSTFALSRGEWRAVT